jgi:hypothetical protein
LEKWEGGKWMELAQDRVRWQISVNTVMEIWEFLVGTITVDFSRRHKLRYLISLYQLKSQVLLRDNGYEFSDVF